jgi:hypothetical protein
MMHGNTNIKENRLRVFENKVLRKISEPQKNDVIGKWRRLHYKEL